MGLMGDTRAAAGAVDGDGGGLTRRQALKRGAVVGGLLWTAPTLQVLSAGAAHADQASSVPPRPKPEPNPGPKPPGGQDCTPSFGLVVLGCGDRIVMAKVDGTGAVDCPSVHGKGAPQDIAKAILGARHLPTGTWSGSPKVTGGVRGSGELYLSWASDCRLLGAATHDGSFRTWDNPYQLDRVGPASVHGCTATFTKSCTGSGQDHSRNR